MISVKEEINKLIDLQKLDSEILSHKRIIEEKPKEILALEAAFEEKKSKLKDLEAQVKDLQVKHKGKETELSSKEENIKKLQTQLYSLKTNKEYQAMLTEIAGHKADCSVIEEDILKIFEEVDNTNSQARKEKEYLVEQEKQLNQEKAKVDQEVSDANVQLNNLEEKRKTMAQAVDAQLLKNYERILESRGGLAVAEVKNDSCQGCFMNMPPQVINEIKLGKNIVVCEMCNRILYIREE